MEPADVIGELPNELLCQICHNVLHEPRSCQQGHTFCRRCIVEWLGQKEECPVGREPLREANLTNVRPLEGIVSRLQVRCEHATAGNDEDTPAAKRSRRSSLPATPVQRPGCGWTGKLSEREAHLRDDCQFAPVACPLDGCGEEVPRHALGAHTAACKYRLVACSFCRGMYAKHELKKHKRRCDEAEVDCEGCGERFKRRERSQHMAACPLVRVTCPFQPHGCRCRPLRRDFAKHQAEAATAHALLVSDKLFTLSEQLADSLKQAERMSERVRTLERRVESLEEDSQSDSEDSSEEYPPVAIMSPVRHSDDSPSGSEESEDDSGSSSDRASSDESDDDSSSSSSDSEDSVDAARYTFRVGRIRTGGHHGRASHGRPAIARGRVPRGPRIVGR